MGLLKKIFYRGCLRDLCFGIGAILFLTSPIIAKAIADFTIYKIGL